MKYNRKLISVIISMILVLSIISVPSGGAAADSAAERLKGAVALYVGSSQALVNNTEVQVDPANGEVTPVLRNGRTLVPVRFISSSLGADVGWDAASRTATITLNNKTVRITIGSDVMKVGNNDVLLDAKAELINNKTFIPLRQLVTALDKEVFYDRGLIVISDKKDIFDVVSDKLLIDETIARVNNLPVVGSLEKLKEILKQNMERNPGYMRAFSNAKKEMSPGADMNAAVAQESKAKADEGESVQGASNDYSTTNTQVEGVDEADIVKTDGEYIFQVNKQRIVVAKAHPAQDMQVSSILTFDDKNFNPQELYLDGQKLVVVGMTYSNVPVLQQSRVKAAPGIMPPLYNKSTVKLIIYDVSDKTNLNKLREVEVEGNYVSSRRIGTHIYLIANRYMNYYYIQNESENLTPVYRDSAVSNDFSSTDYNDMRYFPGTVESNYMLIASVDMNKPDEKAGITTYLGVGQVIYASRQNLYVAVNNYKLTEVKTAGGINSFYENNTDLFKFSLAENNVTYLSKGTVPGRILNQFSMDENGKYFRIATTREGIWDGKEYSSRNNMYVLDEMLNITGRLENIAPGEHIYSTRFMGDRCYMVTFKTVDPLFVIDLKDPAAPKILGALKIPGYSQYLHPYDENHIIGFGKDTVELAQKDWGGRDTGRTMAFYLGLKMAVFDVTDVSKPVEKFSEKIGDRGTDSELLTNHKALLFSKSKNLLAFPVTLMEVKNTNSKESARNNIPEYGQFTFQGAYVYNIDLVKGFTQKGRITHMTDEEYAKSGNYGGDGDKYVGRIIYINDTLYTLSNGVIKASGLDDLKLKKTLDIP